MNQNMPSQKEQDMVAWYVLERPLVRPDTSYQKAARCIALFLLANCGMTFALYTGIKWLGIFVLSSKFLSNLYTNHHILLIGCLFFFQLLIGILFAAKPAAIGAVRLYQHYAPERIRRKCLLKPTCSEYAILVIEKYGVVRGLRKTYQRLFKRCRGRIYRIDEP